MLPVAPKSFESRWQFTTRYGTPQQERLPLTVLVKKRNKQGQARAYQIKKDQPLTLVSKRNKTRK